MFFASCPASCMLYSSITSRQNQLEYCWYSRCEHGWHGQSLVVCSAWRGNSGNGPNLILCSVSRVCVWKLLKSAECWRMLNQGIWLSAGGIKPLLLCIGRQYWVVGIWREHPQLQILSARVIECLAVWVSVKLSCQWYQMPFGQRHGPFDYSLTRMYFYTNLLASWHQKTWNLFKINPTLSTSWLIRVWVKTSIVWNIWRNGRIPSNQASA